jgi:ceramide synthetase
MVVLQVWNACLAWFWNSDVWLPPGFDWADMKENNTRGIKYAEFEDLIYPIPIAVLLLCLRAALERTILYPFGERLGLKNKPRAKVKMIPELEDAYTSRKKLDHKQIDQLAKQAGMEVRQVERWIRRRSVLGKPITLAKFAESGWRFFCYGANLSIGLYVLWDKPWFWDINHCWYDFPHHNITNDIWWYYTLGASYYWSLMFSQFFDHQRRDFWQMFVHHLTTICLLGFSWTCNLTRIGTLVLIIHDCADAFLEIAKMTKYAELEKLCDVLFGLFTIVWIITRLGIYPVYILNSTLIEAPKIVPMFAAYYIFNTLLTILLVLHIFWTWYICRVAFKALTTGKVQQDSRSSTESVSDTTSSDAGVSSKSQTFESKKLQ